MVRSDFCIFILSHGRPDNVKSYHTARHAGYTGKIFIVVDNEDDTIDEYRKNYGDDVISFNKVFLSYHIDTMDNFQERKACVFARNACFYLARELGYKYFCQFDDDYYCFEYRTIYGAICNKKMDDVFNIFLEYFENTPQLTCLAFSQGGDHIGGYNPEKKVKRKAMNSLICCVDRPIESIGTQNDDVTDYVRYGSLGKVFLTILSIQIDQDDSQSSASGMTDIYLDGGTYVKSFYTILSCPSCVKISAMGAKFKRLHHRIYWNNAVPCIINEKYKK